MEWCEKALRVFDHRAITPWSMGINRPPIPDANKTEKSLCATRQIQWLSPHPDPTHVMRGIVAPSRRRVSSKAKRE